MTKRALFIILGVTAVALLAGLVFVVRPAQDEADSTAARAKQINALAVRADTTGKPVAAPQPAAAAPGAASLRAIPADGSDAGILQTLNVAASSSGASLQAVALHNGAAANAPAATGGAAPPPAGVVEVPVSFEVTGTYAAITRFTAALAQRVKLTPAGAVAAQGRLVIIKTLSLTPQDTGSKLTARATATAFTRS